ncbi:MAG: nucleotidyltransferase domain-containing protein [Candidatus Roizmanbacteria bacterium]|nr:nucleotidyltransferase domain-containing protein [Candidatus Roizmanbacteria bacterium]
MNQAIRQELESITQQIVRGYQPEKIILFGSSVSGKRTTDSDFDLFIVKNTREHPIRRAQRLSALVDRKISCDFLVFTPKEVERRDKLGDFFIKDILQTGTTLYDKLS